MDEDGQHDPADVGVLLDTAMAEQADVVYARPSNKPPHGLGAQPRLPVREVARHASWPAGASADDFNSYRLVLGEVARSVAAYAGPGIYLDVAISWVARRVTTAPVPMRDGGRPPVGVRHCAGCSRTSGGSSSPAARRRCGGSASWEPSRCVLAPLVAVVLVVGRATGGGHAPGWTSTMVLLMVATGAILFALGVIAEYVGMAVNMAMGKPLYLPVRDRLDGPLGRDDA